MLTIKRLRLCLISRVFSFAVNQEEPNISRTTSFNRNSNSSDSAHSAFENNAIPAAASNQVLHHGNTDDFVRAARGDDYGIRATSKPAHQRYKVLSDDDDKNSHTDASDGGVTDDEATEVKLIDHSKSSGVRYADEPDDQFPEIPSEPVAKPLAGSVELHPHGDLYSSADGDYDDDDYDDYPAYAASDDSPSDYDDYDDDDDFAATRHNAKTIVDVPRNVTYETFEGNNSKPQMTEEEAKLKEDESDFFHRAMERKAHSDMDRRERLAEPISHHETG